jgi:hypothetical protein
MCPEHFEKALEAPYPFHGGQAKNLLKDCAIIRGYIRNTLGQKGKPQKSALKANGPLDAAPKDNTEFPEADRCLMIFGQRRITEQEVNALHTLATPMRLQWS